MLPKVAISSHYDLAFFIDPRGDEFEAEEESELVVVESENVLKLHSRSLHIKSVEWNGEAVDFSVDEPNGILEVNRIVTAGESARLRIQYSGFLSGPSKPVGIFRSGGDDNLQTLDSHEPWLASKCYNRTLKRNYRPTYPEVNLGRVHGNSSVVAAEISPSSVSRVFPYIGDPSQKSLFRLTLVYPTGFTALTNFPEEKMEYLGDLVRSTFERSPAMLAHMVGFTIGPFETILSRMCPISMHTVGCHSRAATYALGVAESSFAFYQTLFDLKYPLVRLNIVIVPELGQSSFGTLGLIKLIDPELVQDLLTTADSFRQRFFGDVVQAVLDQWLGCLITMNLDMDRKLFAGLREWMMWHAGAHIELQSLDWNHLSLSFIREALIIDRNYFTRQKCPASESPHNDNNQATASDGLANLLMLSSYLTESIFIAGVRRLVRRCIWCSVKSDDLWRCFEAASGQESSLFERFWTMRSDWAAQKEASRLHDL